MPSLLLHCNSLFVSFRLNSALSWFLNLFFYPVPSHYVLSWFSFSSHNGLHSFFPSSSHFHSFFFLPKTYYLEPTLPHFMSSCFTTSLPMNNPSLFLALDLFSSSCLQFFSRTPLQPLLLHFKLFALPLFLPSPTRRYPLHCSNRHPLKLQPPPW